MNKEKSIITRMKLSAKTVLIIIAMGFFLWPIPVLSQDKVTWDSTYRPNVYKMLVDQFHAFPPHRDDIVFLGNSITFWGNWKERLKNYPIKNQGIPGDMTFGVLDRLDAAIKNSPSKVFILIGINDLSHKIPDHVIIGNYTRIIDYIQAKSPSTQILFQTILPTNASLTHLHPANDIVALNAALKKLAAKENIEAIDLYTHFVDSSGNLKEKFTWDGVHLTQKGYAQWVKILKDGHYLQ